MNTQIEIEKRLKNLKTILKERYHVEKLGYFGSYSRNEQGTDSDIDILVYFSKPLGWGFFDLQDFLENELQLKVDLVSEKALKEQLRQFILNSVKFV